MIYPIIDNELMSKKNPSYCIDFVMGSQMWPKIELNSDANAFFKHAYNVEYWLNTTDRRNIRAMQRWAASEGSAINLKVQVWLPGGLVVTKTILSPVISKQNASKKTQIINHIIVKFFMWMIYGALNCSEITGPRAILPLIHLMTSY